VSHYRGGADFEREVRAALAADGYQLVIRSAGSKTKVDLVAFKTDQVLFVQCKRNGVCPPAERAELLRVAGLLPSIAVPVVASRPRVTYRRLTGPGPKDFEPWTPDEIEVA
jgi:holliday junction resolvase Hjr